MDSRRKFRFMGVSLVLFACLASGAAGDNQCETIDTTINSIFSPCPPNPIGIGICTTGTLASGLLKGTTTFVATSLNPGPTQAPGTEVYTGLLSITTNQGTLNISDVGVLDAANNVFHEIDRIQSGTGTFFGAKGILFISGNQTATGFTGRVTGTVCLQSEQ